MTKQQIPKEKGIAAFALTRRATRRETDEWFNERPELRAEVLASLERYSDNMIWQWLKQWHEFPYSVAVIRVIRDEEADTRSAR